jgi:hypothetical protein
MVAHCLPTLRIRRGTMAHRWWMVLLGSASMFCLVAIGPAWAVPKHDFDMGWGKGALYAKQDYGDEKYGSDDEYQKKDKYGKKNKGSGSEKYVKKDYEKWPDGKDGGGDYTKKYKDNDEKKWGYGYGKHDNWKDPDCDPPVATPEPATMLLLGSSLAAAGVYARRSRRP